MKSAGAPTAGYDVIGHGYAAHRQPDPRIAAAIAAALEPARQVLNIGAGTGSYETQAVVAAVEPSPVMIAQRPAGAAACVQARAEALPFPAAAFDATLAVLTTHHWSDVAIGLAEMARVSTRQVVLTWDQRVWRGFWLLRDYFPEIADLEQSLPALDAVRQSWPAAAVHAVPVPADCSDGFLAAYWRRPEAYLDDAVRGAISSFARLPEPTLTAGLAALESDLTTGRWHERNHPLLEAEVLDCGYRLVVNGPHA